MHFSAFFITICTKGRECIFAEDAIDPKILSREGIIARDCWQQIPDHFSDIILDEYIVMPNHVHGILLFEKPIVFKQEFATSIAGSLITIVKTYKAAVTREINRLPSYQDFIVWQRGYYDHRIRDMKEMNRIQRYVKENPRRWIEKYRDI